MRTRPMALVLAVGALLFGCANASDVIKRVVKPPDVSVSNFAIAGIQETKMGFDLELLVKNPNPIGFSLAGLEYQVDLAEKQLATGRNDNGLNITASGDSHVSIPIWVSYQDVLSIYDAVQGQDQVPYKVSGKAEISTPIGKIPVPFSVKGNLPVVRPPRINEVSLKVNKLNLAGAQLNLNLKMFNPNGFKLDIVSGDYALFMQGSNFGNGSIAPSSIPAKTTGTITIPISLSFTGMAGAAYSLLTKGSADYQLSFDARYKLANLPMTQKHSQSGTLKISR